MKLQYSARTVEMKRTLLITLVFAKLNIVGFALVTDMEDYVRNTLKNNDYE